MRTILNRKSTVQSLLVLCLACPLYAETNTDQRFYPDQTSSRLQVGTEELRDNYSALAGLEGLYVDFSVVTKAGNSKGIYVHGDLENKVRAKIEAAGLKMLTEEEITATPGLPILNLWPAYKGADNNNLEVKVDQHQCRIEPHCRSSLWAGYSESASILRRPGKYHRLSTWGSGDESSSCTHRGDWMSKAVLEKVDLLIADFKKAEKESQMATVQRASQVPSSCEEPWMMHLDIFATNQTHLNEGVKPILDKLVSVSNNCPSTHYTVETHADTRADDKYNNMLTIARAHSIKEYLVSKGMTYSKIRTRPMGETQPLSMGNTDEDHATNRRVVILPSTKLTNQATAELDN